MGTQHYFAYGSNLAIAQMTQRCPESLFEGVGRLAGFDWIICERGYANVVKVSKSSGCQSVVWGLVFSVTDADVRLLDRYESVPIAYIKEDLEIDFWPESTKNEEFIKVNAAPQKLTTLVYVDENHVTSGDINSEYVYRMSNGLRDALNKGVPLQYVVEHLLPPIHKGKKYVGSLWDKYLDKDGNPVSDEIPTGSQAELQKWVHRLLDKIRDINPAWGSKGRPILREQQTEQGDSKVE